MIYEILSKKRGIKAVASISHDLREVVADLAHAVIGTIRRWQRENLLFL
jgi:hypothetical protein